MSVRVRFAPSPTGHLHIGGARTALYNYLFAKANGGKYILRIEDTDLERSKKEYEDQLIEELKWLGVTHDEGPDVGGDFGPYRQSERLEIYKKYANQLVDEGKAFPCFCSDEELTAHKENMQQQGLPPHYSGKCRNLSQDEISSKMASGQKAVVRFKAPAKAYVLNDIVRKRIVFPEGMVGDFVIMRSNGMPLYNFCVAIDDHTMNISHVFRAEEHLPNTLRQMMIYEAIGAELPEFGHVSLLIGKDRQKLSKRHGATSVMQYKEKTYLPEAMNNYLCLLGWSHPEEKDIFDVHTLGQLFSPERFAKSPAMFDLEKFNWVNGQHLRSLDNETLLEKLKDYIPQDHFFHKQEKSWQEQCVSLFKDQIEFFEEVKGPLDSLFQESFDATDELKDIWSWETTPKIADYIINELNSQTTEFVTEETFNAWANHIKKELKIKGKNLFKGLRAVLTGAGHGPELKFLIPLTPVSVLKKRALNPYS